VVGERERELFGSSRSFLREFNGWVSKKTREREKERESERKEMKEREATTLPSYLGKLPCEILLCACATVAVPCLSDFLFDSCCGKNQLRTQ
jgi:hypothetical protein